MFADATPTSGSGNTMHVLSTCPLCQAAYNPLKTQVMAERDDTHLLYLVCRQCGSAVVAVVTNNQGGVSSVGTVTDLTSQEVFRFQNSSAVNDDDVVDLYRVLERQTANSPVFVAHS